MSVSNEETKETAALDDSEAQQSAAGDSSATPAMARLRERVKSVLPKRLQGFFDSRRNIAISGGALLLCVLVLWMVFRTREDAFDVQLRDALALLADGKDVGNRQRAREIAIRLKEARYRDPDFAGGVEYVLGIATFRDALDRDESHRDRAFLLAIRYLRDCEQHALDLAYRPEWTFALGVSLHSVGSSGEALPLLQEALKTFHRGRTEASIRLADIYLDRKNPTELRRAIELTESVLRSKDLSGPQRDRAFLQKAQVHLALNQHQEARRALESVSDVASSNQGTRVFRARTLMANAEMLASGRGMSSVSAAMAVILREMSEGKFREALRELEPVSNVVRLDQTFSRQALFLMGMCAERIAQIDVENVSAGKYDAAINYFGRAAQNYQDSHEGVAANLRFAELLRAEKRDEEALQAYRNALGTVKSPERFRNRWLTLAEFRARILDAWNGWVALEAYPAAIELSKLMPPLIPAAQAKELEARANHRWAEHLERELAKIPFSARKIKRTETLARWRQSGLVHAELAKLRRTSSRYPDVLWISAEHFRKGHDFEKSLNQLTRFINTRPKSKLPLAFVRRGQVLMDLDRIDEARDHFKRVIDSYPTDPAAFEAQYGIGACHLERGETDLAETTWRNILSSKALTPDAKEWRRSLFSLGKLLFHSAVILKEQVDKKAKTASVKDVLKQLEQADSRWEESRRRLKEFLERYPKSTEVVEARFLMAKAFQESAQLPRRRLTDAEVENVKVELRRAMYGHLTQARDEFRLLQTRLLREEETGLLDGLGQQFLRDSFFEIAHTYYALDEFDKAIVAYNSAANRYPKDPQVLLAYLQMANCNDRLGEPSEALSMLVQAKVILKQLPDKAFESGQTNLTKKEWENWLDWTRKLRRATMHKPKLRPKTPGT